MKADARTQSGEDGLRRKIYKKIICKILQSGAI